MKVYKTKCGYFYKEYKNGRKKRISKEEYLKFKLKKKQANLTKQKGGNTRITLKSDLLSNSNILDHLKNRYEENINRKISKELKTSHIEGLDAMTCKVCKEQITPTLINKYLVYSTYDICSYCGFHTHKKCFSPNIYQLYGSKDREKKRYVNLCKKCDNFFEKLLSSLISKRHSNVYSDINETNASNIVLVDACGHYLIHNIPEQAGGSSKSLYENNKLFKQIHEKHNSKEFQSLTMGNVVICDYTINKGNIQYSMKIIHAYSYDFRISDYKSLSEEECISLLSKVYTKVFTLFISSNKQILHLLPLSGGIFAGAHKQNIINITIKAIYKAIRSNLTDFLSVFLSGKKQIILCLFDKGEYDLCTL